MSGGEISDKSSRVFSLVCGIMYDYYLIISVSFFFLDGVRHDLPWRREWKVLIS